MISCREEQAQAGTKDSKVGMAITSGMRRVHRKLATATSLTENDVMSCKVLLHSP